ncbi:MAG: hypothetical protein LW816_06485 [Planctomyces sp.]|jgi:hypothetical protein|nr:hypothetical protein [Planctomyces sp.]
MSVGRSQKGRSSEAQIYVTVMDNRQNFPTDPQLLAPGISEIWQLPRQNATAHSANTTENRLS